MSMASDAAAGVRGALSPEFRLYLLGPLRLEHQGQPLGLPRRKAGALLAYLALHPGPHGRERLAALFWGDSPDSAARHSLRMALHALRGALGDELLPADRESVQLNPEFPLWVDALVFEAQATQLLAQEPPDPSRLDLDLYGGDLLSDSYDDWVLRLRERYQRLYLDVLLHLIQHWRTQGEYGRAAELARRALLHEPTDETAHRHLMFGLFMAGDRHAALKQYDQCVQVLREELDVGPAPETVALYKRIRSSPPGGQAVEAPAHNLPLPLTSFVGRQDQVGALKQLLRPARDALSKPLTRLLTLTGPGGSGKTRLAVEVARALVGEYRDGVWWLDLAPLTEEVQVPRTLAKVLGVREGEDETLPETLVGVLRRQQVLLVLDNCEHLVSACAVLAETLLGGCPQLQMLATSREVLGVPGELSWPVLPLALPEGEGALPETVELAQWEGVRLFVERVQAVRGDFRLSQTNGLTVVELCRRLDGLPLAIELAAARAKVMSPAEILARLADRFGLLSQGSRTALPRQQTLRAAVDWSYELLSAPERLLLRRLAVFAGGWTLEVAERICPGEDLDVAQILDLLGRLADKSMLVVEHTGEHTRYRLLETLRQYAAEKLGEAGETEALQRRHLAYYLGLAEAAEPNLRNREQLNWLRRLDADYANLRGALEWALRRDPAPDQHLVGLRLATALVRYWELRDTYSEGRGWLEEALARVETAPLAWRAKALHSAGRLALWQYEHLPAALLLEQSVAAAQAAGDTCTLACAQHDLALLADLRKQPVVAAALWRACTAHFRASGDQWGLAYTLLGQGVAARESGDYEAAHVYDQESAALYRTLGDRYQLSLAIGHLGWIAYKQGDYATARPLIEYRLAVGREGGFRMHLVWCTGLLGEIALAEEDYTAAAGLFKESLVLARARRWDMGHFSLELAIKHLALLARAKGAAKQAVRLLAAEAAYPRPRRYGLASEEAALPDVAQDLRAQLGEAAFEAAWAAGSALDLEQAIEEALAV